MKKYNSGLIITIILLLMSIAFVQGQERRKLAQTGMKFLTVSPSARASAMGDAITALNFKNSTAMFYNPSTMAEMENFSDFTLGVVQWIADINYWYGSYAVRPAQGKYGVFGFTFLNVDYGDFTSTIRAENEQGFLDIGTFSPAAYSVGMGYAKMLSNKFYVGGHFKYVHQDLVGGFVDFGANEAANADNFEEGVVAYDFGIFYNTGFKSLTFGMNVRNFSQEIEYIQESLQLPLTFEMGLYMNVIDLTDMDPEVHTLNLSVDAVHPRDYSEQINMGLEYIFLKSVSLRLGYTSPTDEQGISFGAGYIMNNLKAFGLGIDYSYTNFGVFNDIHRFAFQFSL